MAEKKVFPVLEPDNVHICDLCGTSFPSALRVQRHVKTVHLEVNEEHVKCPKCGIKFKKYETFWEHVLRVHENPNAQAEDVPPPRRQAERITPDDEEPIQVPESKEELETLIKSMISQEDPRKCARCNTTYCSGAGTVRHIREVHLKIVPNQRQRVECALCHRTFVNNSVYNAHYRNVHANIPPSLECPQCHRLFKERKILKRHLKEIHGMMGVEITTLPVANTSSSSLSIPPPEGSSNFVGLPDNVEREDGTFSCQTCQLAFISREGLLRHLRNVHGFKSLEETKPTSSIIQIKTTSTTNSSFSTGSLQCQECSKYFSCRQTLRDHDLVHQKARLERCIKVMLKTVYGAICNSNLTCSLCGVSVQNSTEGKLHVYIKHPETYEELVTAKAIPGALPCQFCDEVRQSVAELMDHVESDHPENPLPVCGVCGVKLLKERDMTNHYKQEHPDASRYACEICKQEFNQRRELEIHMRGQHSADSVQCPYCEEKHVKVKLHVTVKHPERAEEYTKMKKAAIRREQVERMKFNKFLEKGKVHQMTKKALREYESGEEEDLEETDEWEVDKKVDENIIKETEKLLRPERYALRKNQEDPHVIQVTRLQPQKPTEETGNEEEEENEKEDKEPEAIDVKCAVIPENEAENNEGLEATTEETTDKKTDSPSRPKRKRRRRRY